MQQCLRTSQQPLDLARARRQHAGYVAALRELGLEVEVLPALDICPDAVFVEDTAVLLGRRALITRPGAPARRAEVASVREALARTNQFDIHEMTAPARLDGGDVLRVGSRLFVGMSARTNADGVDRLAKLAVREGLSTQTVAVDAGLHLKSAVTAIAETTVIVDAQQLDPRPFQQLGLEVIEAQEPAGANVLALGSTIVVSASAPQTAAHLEARGLCLVRVELDQFHLADGALTCLSLRTAAAGTWCC